MRIRGETRRCALQDSWWEPSYIRVVELYLFKILSYHTSIRNEINKINFFLEISIIIINILEGFNIILYNIIREQFIN